MISLDTNVLIRFLVNDDKDQALRARSLFENNKVWLSKTVLQETEWVLRYSYSFPNSEVNKALRFLLGLEQVEAERPEQIREALDWHEAGLDFSDALHLAGAEGTGKMLTFDKKFINKAREMATNTSVELAG